MHGRGSSDGSIETKRRLQEEVTAFWLADAFLALFAVSRERPYLGQSHWQSSEKS
jgi:hypothetical protein